MASFAYINEAFNTLESKNTSNKANKDLTFDVITTKGQKFGIVTIDSNVTNYKSNCKRELIKFEWEVCGESSSQSSDISKGTVTDTNVSSFVFPISGESDYFVNVIPVFETIENEWKERRFHPFIPKNDGSENIIIEEEKQTDKKERMFGIFYTSKLMKENSESKPSEEPTKYYVSTAMNAPSTRRKNPPCRCPSVLRNEPLCPNECKQNPFFEKPFDECIHYDWAQVTAPWDSHNFDTKMWDEEIKKFEGYKEGKLERPYKKAKFNPQPFDPLFSDKKIPLEFSNISDSGDLNMYHNFFKNFSPHPTTKPNDNAPNDNAPNDNAPNDNAPNDNAPNDNSQSYLKNIFSFMQEYENDSPESLIKKVLESIIGDVNEESIGNNVDKENSETSEEEYYQKTKKHSVPTLNDFTESEEYADIINESDIFTDEMSSTEEDHCVVESEDSSGRIKDLKKSIRENNLPKIIRE